jgi:hypothetical protein
MLNMTPQHIKFDLFVKNKTGQLRAIFELNQSRLVTTGPWKFDP